MAYILEQVLAALGKVKNGGIMVADLQSLVSSARNEAAANRVERNTRSASTRLPTCRKNL
ncbi:MAG TPA: hypothetical protein DHV71_00765 [Acidaminococcaceae bacterium]|nr:hypothetical protein [Acidaminococcaceae bacterium]